MGEPWSVAGTDEWDVPIPIYRASIDATDLDAATASLESGWLGMGEAVGRFEDSIADLLGILADRVVAVSTGSAALHISLLLAGVRPGDEVVVPAFSHLADVQAILACGAEPVFCDVSDDTLCVGVAEVAAAMSARTRAVVALDYAGALIDEPALRAALGPGVRLVRDAAHSFGASSRGVPVGSESDLCTFSFDPVKALTCVDGGIVIAGSAEEATQARQVRILGSDQPPKVMYGNARSWDYDAVGIGFRYHLSNVHAAIGQAQLAKLEAIRENRRRACRRYLQSLAGAPGVRPPLDTFEETNPFLFWIRVSANERDPLRDHLAAHGIDTGIHWRPSHLHSYFRGFRRAPLPVTERAGEEILSLPLHSAEMDLRLIDRVCDTIASRPAR
jgi:dTDP-4-amino-4,6-dideoxygalactose transaminase